MNVFKSRFFQVFRSSLICYSAINFSTCCAQAETSMKVVNIEVDVPHDTKYNIIRILAEPHSVKFVSSEDDGAAGINFSFDLVDCQSATIKNMGEGSTMEEAISGTPLGQTHRIIKGSPDEALATASCSASGSLLNISQIEP